jgi:arginase family enzyme
MLEYLPRLKGRPVYISLDIDVADPSFAPGPGTSEPGKITLIMPSEVLKAPNFHLTSIA